MKINVAVQQLCSLTSYKLAIYGKDDDEDSTSVMPESVRYEIFSEPVVMEDR
ncbi:hypothetical protein [uncultured Robinsoniella sp.]|uniref:hypothetical protein n=1 Tax=uncultured Robinsoniella sp. TaxID=904190 RepID=UPI00374F87D2